MKKWIFVILLSGAGGNTFSQDTTHLSLLFLGDIMQHDSQISGAFDPSSKKYDYDPCFRFVKPYIQSADLAIGNLELTLAGRPYKGYPQFSAPDELLFTLKDIGLDVLVTANNHCVDRGKKGLERTIRMLDSLHIPHTGTFSDEVDRLHDYPLLVKKNGFRLALLNYTYGTNGLPVTAPNIVNTIDTVVMKADLEKARSMKTDQVIVFIHWGLEYQRLPSKMQKSIAAFCFRHGAQLVIGSHPHVLQPMEWRKDKDQLVVYSLGNFVSGQRKRYTDGGAMAAIGLEKITFDADSAVTKVDTSNYILQWVYRTNDAEKNYYVLPVPSFENDTTGFIKDPDSRHAFTTFVNDSRALYKKYNLDISESVAVPSDSLVTYRILYFTSDNDHREVPSVIKIPFGLEMEAETNEDGTVSYYSGAFLNRDDAEKFRQRIAADTVYRNAVIMKFIAGQHAD